MSLAAGCLLKTTLTPFLYPFTTAELLSASQFARRLGQPRRRSPCLLRRNSTTTPSHHESTPTLDAAQAEHLNPPPDSYSLTPFTDHCTVTLHTGSGGHGCVSFLREKFIAHGPPNGGDGGSGGNIYIQAVRGETSLHKIARRREVKAGRGKNGQGSDIGGKRGEDILLQVPVGTVVREIGRMDPITIEEEEFWEEISSKRKKHVIGDEEGDEMVNETIPGMRRREKWLLFPSADPSIVLRHGLPDLPKPRRSNLQAACPPSPIHLDLDEHMENPIILAAGAMGGLGNPHFLNKDFPRPKFATKGDTGMKLVLHMELKLLADVGLVGLPNAGKSTLLRSISNSRARVGNWAFTTLQPNIGTIVLDDYKGRSRLEILKRKSNRTRFTIADIPGVIEDAHLDKGLGLSFLRHIERAAILAFVIDLSAGPAVPALKALWKEVGEYETLRAQELAEQTEARTLMAYQPLTERTNEVLDPFADQNTDPMLIAAPRKLPPLVLPPVSAKPWFVVATKADLPNTQENFAELVAYIDRLARGVEAHPSGKKNGWKADVRCIPISAIKGQGVDQIPSLVLDLLDA
jgi:GTP-binding protein